MDQVLEYSAIAGLLLVNAVGVFLVALQMPGTWLMLVVSALFAWWQPDRVGVWILLVLLALAIVGEIIETFAAAAGASKAGGSKRGAVLAVVLSIVGAILGTALIPIPLVGTIVGACVGAGLGSIAGDRWAGRTWEQARQAGRGAAIGKLWGTLGKIAVAALMWALIAVAVFV